MKTTITEFKKDAVEIHSVFGGQRILVKYNLITDCEGVKNQYVIKCEMCGLEDAKPFLRFF